MRILATLRPFKRSIRTLRVHSESVAEHQAPSPADISHAAYVAARAAVAARLDGASIEQERAAYDAAYVEALADVPSITGRIA